MQYSIPLKRFPKDKRDNKIYRRRLEFIGNYIGWDHRDFLKQNIKKGGKLLEIGCGTGDFVYLANKNNYQAKGVDLDKAAVLAGRNYWKIDFIYSMSAKDYFTRSGKEKFDVICFFAVLEHIENPHEIFNEIKKYLAPDGYICFSTPNNDSILNKVWGKITKVDYPPHHLTRWNKKSIEIFLKLHGFEIVLRKTCEPTVTDIIPDLYKLYSPFFLKIPIVMLLSGLNCMILFPLDFVRSTIKKCVNR